MRKKQLDILICDMCGAVVGEFANTRNMDKVHAVVIDHRSGGTRALDHCVSCASKVNAFFDKERKDGTSSEGSK